MSLIVAAVVAIPFGLPRAHEAMNPEGLAMMLGLALLVPLLPYALEMTALRRMPMSAFGILMSSGAGARRAGRLPRAEPADDAAADARHGAGGRGERRRHDQRKGRWLAKSGPFHVPAAIARLKQKHRYFRGPSMYKKAVIVALAATYLLRLHDDRSLYGRAEGLQHGRRRGHRRGRGCRRRSADRQQLVQRRNAAPHRRRCRRARRRRGRQLHGQAGSWNCARSFRAPASRSPATATASSSTCPRTSPSRRATTGSARTVLRSLDPVAIVLRKFDRTLIDVDGHTDLVGNAAFNQDLSERRANSVANHLASRGIDQRRMSTMGYGLERPIASNATESGRAQNRRVEIAISLRQ